MGTSGGKVYLLRSIPVIKYADGFQMRISFIGIKTAQINCRELNLKRFFFLIKDDQDVAIDDNLDVESIVEIEILDEHMGELMGRVD